MTFRARLRARGLVIGSVITLPDVSLAELTAGPADFVWIDLEHGALGIADVQPLAIAARAAGAAALVRVESPESALLGAVLDAGVDGIVAPGVESASQVYKLTRRLRYPPAGTRGFAARRTPANREVAHDPLCLVQIETQAGVQHAADIAGVEGVDALVVGCADLSLALGEEPIGASAALEEAVGLVQEAAAGAGLPSGVAGPADPDRLLQLAAGRSTCLVMSADVRIYTRAVESQLSQLRNQPSHVRA